MPCVVVIVEVIVVDALVFFASVVTLDVGVAAIAGTISLFGVVLSAVIESRRRVFGGRLDELWVNCVVNVGDAVSSFSRV